MNLSAGNKMIRVIYKFKIKEEMEAQFIEGWTQTTHSIRNNITGALGSILLKSKTNKLEFIAIARWSSVEDWQSFRNSEIKPDPVAIKKMYSAGELISTEVLDELEFIQ